MKIQTILGLMVFSSLSILATNQDNSKQGENLQFKFNLNAPAFKPGQIYTLPHDNHDNESSHEITHESTSEIDNDAIYVWDKLVNKLEQNPSVSHKQIKNFIKYFLIQNKINHGKIVEGEHHLMHIDDDIEQYYGRGELNVQKTFFMTDQGNHTDQDFINFLINALDHGSSYSVNWSKRTNKMNLHVIEIIINTPGFDVGREVTPVESKPVGNSTKISTITTKNHLNSRNLQQITFVIKREGDTLNDWEIFNTYPSDSNQNNQTN